LASVVERSVQRMISDEEVLAAFGNFAPSPDDPSPLAA
jgi:hypothetical protein